MLTFSDMRMFAHLSEHALPPACASMPFVTEHCLAMSCHACGTRVSLRVAMIGGSLPLCLTA
jgi:hypothetical protein